MFVNITHPAQLRDQKVQRQVKRFTSRLNLQRHELDQLQRLGLCPGAQGLIEEAETLLSEQGDTRRKEQKRQLSSVPNPNFTPTEKEGEVFNVEDSPSEGGGSEDSSRRPDLEVEEEKSRIYGVLSEHGGLRIAHVDTYPPTYVSTHLRGLLNYYVLVFGPDDIWNSITQPVLLEALFALCQARRDRKVTPDGSPSMVVLLHRGKVLEMMQDRIASADTAIDDITLLAVAGLISLDLMFQKWRSLRYNLKGFRRIATMRGVDNLGWEGLFKSYLGWAELSWAGHVAELAAKHKCRKLPEYPTHSFPSSFSVMIFKLPKGIAEQALDLGLSVQVISFLEQVTKLIKARKQPGAAAARSGELYLKRVQLTTRVKLILGTLELRQEEPLLCIGAMANIIFLDGPIVVYKYPTEVEDHIVAIPRWVALIVPTECMLWIAVVIASSIDGEMTPKDSQWFLLDLVLADEDVSKNWEVIRTTLNKFY